MLRKQRKKRTLTKKLLVKGVIVEATTMAGFAERVNRNKRSILRYEQLGILPVAPLSLKGVRYYPLRLVERVAPLIARLPLHKKPDPELLVEINKVFQQEKQYILCQRNLTPQKTTPRS